MCLYEPKKKFLISGDHLLKDDVPSIRGKIGNKNVLTQYLLSLDKVEALDVDYGIARSRGPLRQLQGEDKRAEELSYAEEV